MARVIWPWRTPPAAPVAGTWAQRRRALIQCAVTAIVATLLTLGWGRYRLGLIVYGFSAVILICGFLAPKAFAFLERLGRQLAHAVALALTWALLMPFFYLCFAPAHLVMKVLGKDPLRRRFERDRSSYWEDHKLPAAPRPYTRQY